jgi:hypothetical protein
MVVVLALVLAWPASATPSQPTQGASVEELRQFLATVTVRIDIEMPDKYGLCTGWIGWTEASRSAVYTAAHCHSANGRYRTKSGASEAIYADGYAKWEGSDLMALWIPRGGLPVLWSWKPLPDTPFRALYMLHEPRSGMRLVEVDIPRAYRDIRLVNNPNAVAVPLQSYPGTSGAPIVDMADGMLVGMVVGFLEGRPDIAAVIPAETIYKTVLSTPPH